MNMPWVSAYLIVLHLATIMYISRIQVSQAFDDGEQTGITCNKSDADGRAQEIYRSKRVSQVCERKNEEEPIEKVIIPLVI